MAIDKRAKVHRKVEIGRDVEIGAYTVVDEGVRIWDGTWIGNNATITGLTEIGKDNQIFHNAVIGTPAQTRRLDKEPTRVVIGDSNVLREFVTVNAGTMAGGGVTIVGNHNFLMACSHVAHDSVLEDNITMANAVLLAGHVKVERGVTMGGGAAVHQFVTIGELAMVGGLTPVTQDIPPYMVVDGPSTWPRNVNIIGLRRNGVSEDSVSAIEDAFRLIYRSRLSRIEALKKIETELKQTEEIKHLADFLRKTEQRKRGRYLEGTRH